MKIISKQDFQAFVNALIQDDTLDVQGVKAKGEKFVFGPIDSATELRLDYDVTILPPKKYFLPQYETMMVFDIATGTARTPALNKKKVIVGVHPYDLVAIQQMDKYFLDTNVDDVYLAKRKNSLLIGMTPMKASETAFYGDLMKDAGQPDLHFDLMLTDLGDSYAVLPGTPDGAQLLARAVTRDAQPQDVEATKAAQKEAMGKAIRGLKVGPKGWHSLLTTNYESNVWKEQAENCLACGSCTLVCPTCFCYDVNDEVELDLTSGVRTRTWDGCLLRDFTKVAPGEIFREDIVERYRHRINRKGKYLPDALGFVACVGCGRCSSACIPDIADPLNLINKLAESTMDTIPDADVSHVPEISDLDIIASDSLYIPRTATIRRMMKLTEKETFFEIGLDDGQPLGHQPGQFVEVSIFGVGEAPISVSSPPGGNTFQLVVRNVGDLTNKLHSLSEGDKIGIRGPFGTGFDTAAMKGKNLLFIGGGLGIVPMRSLIKYVVNNRQHYGKVMILYGCRDPTELLFKDEIAQWENMEDVEMHKTVDTCAEGETWNGQVGVITTIMPLVTFDPLNTYAIVVGPPIMYRFVNRDLLNMGMPPENIIVSLERRMKCGVGKCGHCQINGVYVCKEGPVFNYKDIIDQPEAFS